MVRGNGAAEDSGEPRSPGGLPSSARTADIGLEGVAAQRDPLGRISAVDPGGGDSHACECHDGKQGCKVARTGIGQWCVCRHQRENGAGWRAACMLANAHACYAATPWNCATGRPHEGLSPLDFRIMLASDVAGRGLHSF